MSVQACNCEIFPLLHLRLYRLPRGEGNLDFKEATSQCAAGVANGFRSSDAISRDCVC